MGKIVILEVEEGGDHGLVTQLYRPIGTCSEKSLWLRPERVITDTDFQVRVEMTMRDKTRDVTFSFTEAEWEKYRAILLGQDDPELDAREKWRRESIARLEEVAGCLKFNEVLIDVFKKMP